LKAQTPMSVNHISHGINSTIIRPIPLKRPGHFLKNCMRLSKLYAKGKDTDPIRRTRYRYVVSGKFKMLLDSRFSCRNHVQFFPTVRQGSLCLLRKLLAHQLFFHRVLVRAIISINNLVLGNPPKHADIRYPKP